MNFWGAAAHSGKTSVAYTFRDKRVVRVELYKPYSNSFGKQTTRFNI
jgi:hypothetical protein